MFYKAYMILPEIDVIDTLPLEVETLALRAVAAVNSTLSPVLFSGKNITFGLRIDTDAAIQTLNKDFREKDKPTNVLSFPADIETLEPDECYLGDIIMATGVLQREAVALNVPLAHHFMHLVVHGALHIMEYDHIVDAEAQIMEPLEILILAKLDIPNPYE